MRHQKRGRKFGRVRNQRKALLRTMLGSLIMKEKIQTTEAKAKELKSKIDRLINKGKKAKDSESKMSAVRTLSSQLPLMAIKKVTGEDFIKRFANRNSGYSRVIKLPRRKGDGAKMAVIELLK